MKAESSRGFSWRSWTKGETVEPDSYHATPLLQHRGLLTTPKTRANTVAAMRVARDNWKAHPAKGMAALKTMYTRASCAGEEARGSAFSNADMDPLVAVDFVSSQVLVP